MPLRRIIIISLFLFLSGIVGVAAIYLYNFDLNNFRSEIENALSEQIERPISLGNAHLSFKHGPAFAFDNVTIGTVDDDLHVSMEHLFFRLQTLPLLTGEILFSEILFEAPVVTLHRRKETGGQPFNLNIVPEPRLLKGDLIRSLRVQRGEIRIIAERDGADAEKFEIEELRFRIDDFSFLRAGQIEAQGTLRHRGVRSPFVARGEYHPSSETTSWDGAYYRFSLDVEHLAAKSLRPWMLETENDIPLRGYADLSMTLEGIPQQGVNIATRLSGRQLDLVVPAVAPEPLGISAAELQGRLQHTPDGIVCDTASLAVKTAWGEVNITGRGELAHDGNRTMQGNIRGQFATRAKPGSPLTTDPAISPNLASSFSLDLARSDAGWKITHGTADLHGIRSHFTGDWSTDALQLRLQLQAASLTSLRQLFPRINAHDLSGQLNAMLNIRRQFDRFHGSGRITLNDVQIIPPAGKSSLLGPLDDLAVATLETNFQLNLERASDPAGKRPPLDLLGMQFELPRSWRLSASQPTSLGLDLVEARLAADRNGQRSDASFNGKLQIETADNHRLTSSGELTISDANIFMTRNLARLNHLHGRIELANNRVTAKQLQAELGRSPISIDLEIPNLRSPETILHVRGDSIRADELIFTSKRLFLREVDGIVRLTGDRVLLGPIHVKMDGGTDATVSGSVRNFAAPDTRLDIYGRHGNLDEIIDLWEEDESAVVRQNEESRGSLHIDIVTDSGQISGMQFERATSPLTRRGRTLVIGPIRFAAGQGKGIGQVLSVRQPSGPSKLRISGNVTDFDAQVIYQQLLKRRGLVSGRLSGDFYLEGIAGKQFLPTSLGSFSMQVQEGRLYKMTGLAKILQFLNLLPVLTENVRGKGLPYEIMTFNSTLDAGTLTTSDFLMKGDIMNLSLTGDYNLIDNRLDLKMGAMPLRSVDSILSHIPIAGWLLTGSDRALVVAHFEMTGDADDPDIDASPVESVASPVIGIFERVFSLPVKVLTDPGQVIINK